VAHGRRKDHRLLSGCRGVFALAHAWEACGTPRYLMAPMRKDPLGIAAWMEQMRRSVPRMGMGYGTVGL
jgi:hypothetical protein